MSGFLNSAIRNLHYSFIFYIDEKSGIANFDEIALFKFCSLIIKWISPLCSFDGLVSACVLGAKGFLRGASEVTVKRGGTKRGGTKRGRRKAELVFEQRPRTPHPPLPRTALIFLLYIGILRKVSDTRRGGGMGRIQEMENLLLKKKLRTTPVASIYLFHSANLTATHKLV